MTALLAALLMQLEQGIVVETDSPDAHCPDLHQTREAVNARLGTIQGRGYRSRYTIVHAPGEIPRDFVLLELSSADGKVLLRRELPIGESCASVAEAIALVLDQYFRALVTEETQPDEAATQKRDDSAHHADQGIADQNGGKPALSSEQSPPSWLAMLEMSAGSFSSSVAAGLRFQSLLSPAWHFGVEVVIPFSDRKEALPEGGEARARSFELAAHLGFGPELGAVRPYVGPTLFAMLERAYTTSPLENRTQYRLLAGIGAELGLDVRLGERWRTVAFAGLGGIFAQSATFVVAGDEVLGGIGWVGTAGLGFAYTF
jgi:hypothetical protein